MVINIIRIWLKCSKKAPHENPDLVYENVEVLKEIHGIKIMWGGTFANINKAGESEIFIPYNSILYTDIRTVNGDANGN